MSDQSRNPHPETLLTLADRVEAATAGDRELDALYAVATEYDLPTPMGECRASLRMPSARMDYERVAPGHYWLVQMSGISLRSAPRFTETPEGRADAAAALRALAHSTPPVVKAMGSLSEPKQSSIQSQSGECE